ncbi:MAG: DUF262 domain-containing protein [Gammaproteobacteria bacterium]|nr:DUF262 domain-containing protein [Gammaproteobacteria bacterium]
MKMTPHRRALDKIYKRRDRYDIPDWQRERVWGKARKQKLIDSILRGWRLPKFYFLLTSDEPEEFEVVDGQQRLLAIWEFFDNELALSSDSDSVTRGAKLYRDLPDQLSDRFDDYEIDYDQIEDAPDDADLKEFFQRLQEGLPLTTAERLNSVHSKLRDFCRKLSTHRFFANKTSVSPRRYGHFDIVAKVAALEIEGLDAGLRYDDLKATFEAHKEFASSSSAAKRLRQTLNILDVIFPDKDTRLRNRTIVQSLSTLVGSMTSKDTAKSRAADLREFVDSFLNQLAHQVERGQEATDKDFIQFQKTVNANVRSGPRTRQNILLRKFLVHDPTFADLFGLDSVAGCGLNEEIARLAKGIGSAVTGVNHQYSGMHGKDLIKMTNRTTEALLRLGTPISDLEEYKQLIDDLYFLFDEGPDSRLQDKPQSFTDIKQLRTDLRHDLDHGKPGKAAKKRQRIGTVFARYAGSPSPQTVAPERFPAIQGSILRKVSSDLENIRDSLGTSAK